jgi:hypothetical protein
MPATKAGSLECPLWDPFGAECRRKLRRALGRNAGERARFVCPVCQIEWGTGLDVPYDD